MSSWKCQDFAQSVYLYIKNGVLQMRVLALLPGTLHDNFTFNNSIELGILQNNCISDGERNNLDQSMDKGTHHDVRKRSSALTMYPEALGG